jgi:hypothetical protein
MMRVNELEPLLFTQFNTDVLIGIPLGREKCHRCRQP